MEMLLEALYFGNDSHLGAPKALRITCSSIEFYSTQQPLFDATYTYYSGLFFFLGSKCKLCAKHPYK